MDAKKYSLNTFLHLVYKPAQMYQCSAAWPKYGVTDFNTVWGVSRRDMKKYKSRSEMDQGRLANRQKYAIPYLRTFLNIKINYTLEQDKKKLRRKVTLEQDI